MGRNRMIAFAFDFICITLLYLFVGVILSKTNLNMLIEMTITSVLLCVGLFCKDCYNGTSPGKYIMRIQIVDKKTMKPASPIKCIIRNLLYPLWIVELIVFICNKNRKRLGDYITNTEVDGGIIRAKNINCPQIIISVLVIVFLSLVVSYISYQTHPFYKLLLAQ